MYIQHVIYSVYFLQPIAHPSTNMLYFLGHGLCKAWSGSLLSLHRGLSGGGSGKGEGWSLCPTWSFQRLNWWWPRLPIIPAPQRVRFRVVQT